MTRRAPRLRILVLPVLGLVAALAACDRDKPRTADAPPETAPRIAPRAAAVPLAYESKTPFADVRLTLPPAIRTQPALHARVYDSGVRDLRQFTEGAQGDRTEYGGDADLPPYRKSLTWTLAADTPRLFSLRGLSEEDTGGVHPNSGFTVTLWDKAQGRDLAPAALFRADADFTVLDRALCAAINSEKRRRNPQSRPVVLGDAEGEACPRAIATPYILTPSTTPGKAAGLTFLIAPYQVGPYSEGRYEITLPVAVVGPLIAPGYIDEFGGQAAGPLGF